jgi:GNAT superfamily N-acetyltransferase
MRILPLTGGHDREPFDCGREELNLWLRRIARQHQDKGLSRTYVAVDEAAPARILGYYALTLTEIDATDLPAEARKRFPRRIPGVRLGRLAVERGIQGKGIGSLLLVDAIERARRVRCEAGSVGLFVDAIDAAGAVFYLKHGFSASPGNPLLLFPPVG